MLLFFLITQIIFESLPVSSSGHALLFGLNGAQSVEYFLHLGAVGIFLFYIATRRLEIITWWRLLGRDHWKRYFLIILFSSITTLCALLVKRYIGLQNFEHFLPLGFGITSIALLSLTIVPRNNYKLLPTYSDAFCFSFAQILALFFPGVSRMALVFVAARWSGWSERGSLYWMIALALPLFAGAGVLGLLGGGIRSIVSVTGLIVLPVLFVSTIISGALFFLAAHLARTGRFWWFGLYTALIGSILFFFPR